MSHEVQPAEPAVSIQEIIALLEDVRKRKVLYIGTCEPRDIQSFISGFLVACEANGISCGWREIAAAEMDRSWKSSPAGPVPEMRLRGLSEDEIADELLFITIRAFQRMAANEPLPQDLAP